MALVALLAGRGAAATAPAPAGGDGLSRVRASRGAPLGRRPAGRRAVRLPGPARSAPASSASRSRSPTRWRAGSGCARTFVQNDWQLLIPALERGDIDVILNGLEVTDGAAHARRVHAAVLRVSRRRWSSGATTPDGPLRSPDLRGHRVGTLGGSLSQRLRRSRPGRRRRAVRGHRGALPRPRARPARRRRARRHHRRALRPGAAGLARRRRGGGGRLRHRHAARRAGAPARRRRRAGRHGARAASCVRSSSAGGSGTTGRSRWPASAAVAGRAGRRHHRRAALALPARDRGDGGDLGAVDGCSR